MTNWDDQLGWKTAHTNCHPERNGLRAKRTIRAAKDLKAARRTRLDATAGTAVGGLGMHVEILRVAQDDQLGWKAV